jgi:RNA polymerase sigma-70 factor (ECF subfamily)
MRRAGDWAACRPANGLERGIASPGRADQPDETVMSNPRDDFLPLIPRLRAYARSLTRGNVHLADDVVQDTVVLALQAWSRFTPGNLEGWLLQIAHNRFHSLISRKHVTAEVFREDLATLGRVPAVQEQRIELADFARAFAALSREHREVIGLVVMHEQSYEAAARICGCKVGTVKSRLSRARAILKQTFLDPDELRLRVHPPVRQAAPFTLPAVLRPLWREDGLGAALDQHGRARQGLEVDAAADGGLRHAGAGPPRYDLERTMQ